MLCCPNGVKNRSDSVITTVCLNPSVDHTVEVEHLETGALNRVISGRYDAGGKGLNVAVSSSALGLDAECVGFMYRESARLFEKRLLKSATAYDFIWCEGRARTNLKIFDRSRGEVTEINEPGIGVQEADLQKMTELVVHRAAHADFLVLSGSMPPNCPWDYYRTLISRVEGLGCRCILDADGERLKLGIEAKPFLIKPNRYELELLTGRELHGIAEIACAAREVQEQGVEVVAVSMGAEGALIVCGDECLYAKALSVPVRSTVGAGDSMVAGLAAGFLMEADLETAFRMGVAAAGAKCMAEGSDTFSRADYKALIKQVEIQNMEA